MIRVYREGLALKGDRTTVRKKKCLSKCAGNGNNFIREQEKQAVGNDPGGLPAWIAYVSGTISCKDIIFGAWNCQTVSGSGLGNAVWRAAINMERNSCICNWRRDRKMSKSATVGEAEYVTAHEVSCYGSITIAAHFLQYGFFCIAYKKCYQNRKMIAESVIRIEIFYHILSSLYISARF